MTMLLTFGFPLHSGNHLEDLNLSKKYTLAVEFKSDRLRVSLPSLSRFDTMPMAINSGSNMNSFNLLQNLVMIIMIFCKIEDILTVRVGQSKI